MVASKRPTLVTIAKTSHDGHNSYMKEVAGQRSQESLRPPARCRAERARARDQEGPRGRRDDVGAAL